MDLDCGEEDDPCDLPGIANFCADNPNDPICTEEDENGCVPILDPNWCQDPGEGVPGSGDGSGGGDGGGGGGDPPDPPPIEEYVSLACSGNVVRGSVGGCTLSTTGDVFLSNIEWEAGVVDGVATASGITTWAGVIAQLQTPVTVTFDSNVHGPGQEFTANIVATPRNWSWAGLVDNRQANGSEVDHCLDPSDAGRAVGSQCTSPADADAILVPTGALDGYAVGAGTGPNEGVYFVKDPTTHLSMRSTVAPRYRPDGPQHPIQGTANFMSNCGGSISASQMNNHQVNGACPGTQFSQFFSHAWAHENQHLTLAEGEAIKPGVDLHKKWEGLVFPSAAWLETEVSSRRYDSYQDIYQASAAIDQGAPGFTFTFWAHGTGTGFDTATVSVH